MSGCVSTHRDKTGLNSGVWSLSCPRGQLWPRARGEGLPAAPPPPAQPEESASPAQTGALQACDRAGLREAAAPGQPRGALRSCRRGNEQHEPEISRAGHDDSAAPARCYFCSGLRAQELWDVMEICKSANQTASFKEGKDGLAGRD